MSLLFGVVTIMNSRSLIVVRCPRVMLTVRGVRDGCETVWEFVETTGMFLPRHIIRTSGVLDQFVFIS